jgi:hypothetical protein
MKLHGFMNKGIMNDVSLNIKSFKKKKKKTFGICVIVVCFVDDKQDLGQE